MTTKQITVDEEIHEALKRAVSKDGPRKGMTIQGLTDEVIRTGLRVKRIEVQGDGR